MDSINATVKAAFVSNADKEIQRGIEVSQYVRSETLNRAYAVNGYIDMPLAEKNRIYDEIQKEIIAELAAMGIEM
jgi:hypothetical protein